MKGTFVQDPGDPGDCSPTNNAFNKVSARVTVVVAETGLLVQ